MVIGRGTLVLMTKHAQGLLSSPWLIHKLTWN